MRIILSILIIILLFPYLVQAEVLDIKTENEQYSPGETVAVEINVNNQLSRDLQNSDFKLFLQSQNIPIAITKTKINSTLYYLSFDVPNTQSGTYEFGAYDIFYNDNGVSKKITIKKQLIILDNKENILSFKPVVYTQTVGDIEEAPFTIFLKNNGQNEINAELSTISYFIKINNPKIYLPSGSSKIINIQTAIFDKNKNYFNGDIKITHSGKSNNIKIILYKTIKYKNNETINITDNTKRNANLILTNTFGVPINTIELNMEYGENKIIDFNIINSGDSEAENISLKLTSNNEYISIIPVNIESIRNGTSYPITLELNPQNNSGNITSSLEINYNKNIIIIPMKIFVTSDIRYNKPVIINDTIIQQPITEPKQEENNVKFLLAFSIFILIIIILLVYAYKKIKPKQEEFDEFVQSMRNR